MLCTNKSNKKAYNTPIFISLLRNVHHTNFERDKFCVCFVVDLSRENLVALNHFTCAYALCVHVMCSFLLINFRKCSHLQRFTQSDLHTRKKHGFTRSVHCPWQPNAFRRIETSNSKNGANMRIPTSLKTQRIKRERDKRVSNKYITARTRSLKKIIEQFSTFQNRRIHIFMRFNGYFINSTS